jgi:flagellar basal body rod protein FlgC
MAPQGALDPTNAYEGHYDPENPTRTYYGYLDYPDVFEVATYKEAVEAFNCDLRDRGFGHAVSIYRTCRQRVTQQNPNPPVYKVVLRCA